MKRLLGQLLQLCLLRIGPQDLPYSPRLTRGLVLCAVGFDLLVLRLVDPGPHALSRGLASLAFLLLLPWLLLRLRHRSSRYAQTLAAFVGSGLLFTLVFLPFAWHAATLPPAAEGVAPAPADALIVVAAMLLVGWKLAINGHIWRHALDWPRGVGLPFALALFLAELSLLRAWFPAAAT